MKHSQAIVTLALGDSYVQHWKRVCEPNWRHYAAMHGFDVVFLQEPLDTSERARKRSPSWQKCLILSNAAVRDYEQVVWIDSDVVINHNLAPSIVQGVSPSMVGAAEHLPLSHTRRDMGREVLRRMSEYWRDQGIANDTAEEYYTRYGLPAGCHEVLNAGVMVLSPSYHRELLEYVYNSYEERGGREWHMEMRPLSYELIKAGLVQWIDPRFNVLLPDLIFLHYPFLLHASRNEGLAARARRVIGRSVLDIDVARTVRSLCVNAALQASFFLHFGGSNFSDMELIEHEARSWLETRS